MATNGNSSTGFDLETQALLAGLLKDNLTPSYLEALTGQIGAVNRIVKEFLATAERIEGSRDFTPEGKKHRLGELALVGVCSGYV